MDPRMDFMKLLMILTFVATTFQSEQFPTFPTWNIDQKLITVHTEVDINRPNSDQTQIGTYYFKQYYNSLGWVQNRVDQVGENVSRTILYDEDIIKTPIFIEYPSLCQVNNSIDIQFEDQAFYGFNTNFMTGDFGPLSIWTKLSKNKAKINFVKKDIARGIKVNRWNITLDNLTITAYTANSTTELIPIQIHIKGLWTTEYLQNINLDDYYNYVFFEKNIEDSTTAFNIPTGMGCVGLPAVSDFTGFPKAFDFTAEVSNVFRKTSYSHQHKLTPHYVKILHDDSLNVTTLFGEDKYRDTWSTVYINDFKAGVTYNIDIKEQDDEANANPECSINGIGSESTMNAHGQYQDISLKLYDPKHYFIRNANFYRCGSTNIRGMKADIYETIKSNFSLEYGSKESSKVVFTYYLSEEDWFEGSTDIKKLPLRLSISVYDNSGHLIDSVTIDFFDYDLKASKWMFQMIRFCFPRFMLYPEITLNFDRKMTDQVLMSSLNDYFAQELRLQLIKTLNIFPTRVPEINVDYSSDKIYAKLRFAPSINSTDHYLAPVRYFSSKSTSGYGIMVRNKEGCASACAANSRCQMFIYCEKTPTMCHIEGVSFKPHTHLLCYSYKKGPFFNGHLEQSYMDIMKVIYLDKMFRQNLTVELKTQNTQLSYKISSIPSPHRKRPDDLSYGTKMTDSLDSFKIKDFAADVASMTTTTLKDCESFCKSNSDCESISYCDRSKKCQISSLVIDQYQGNEKKVEYDSGCNILIKPYLNMFVKYNNIVTVEEPNKIASAVNSNVTCAKACLDEKSFDCHTFQWCKETDSCLLFNQTYLTGGKKGGFNNARVTRKDCSIYTKLITSGFKYAGVRIVKGYSGHRIEGISNMHECGKQCVDDTDKTCNSYDYCPGYKNGEIHGLCIIRHTMHPPKNPLATFNNSNGLKCIGFYKMKPEIDPFNSRPIKEASTTVKKTGNQWSSGGVAGLAIGLMIVGALLSALLFVIFLKRKVNKSSNHDGMSISFSKQVDDD